MARKSINGYKEKNYYDNTKFSGITATYDALNEGMFRHMVNFDIADTGKSITPREGFLTTEFINDDNNPISLSTNTIYFQEPNTGEYIFIDFSTIIQIEGVVIPPVLLRTSFILDDNKFKSSIINGIDASALYTYLNIDPTDYTLLKRIEPVSSNFAEIMYDTHGVKQNVIKIKFGTIEGTPELHQLWINILYNTSEDKLYITPVDTNNTVAVSTDERNIASFASIVPDPLYKVYTEDDPAPIGHYNRIPMIYAKQGDKYLIQTTNILKDLELYPSFFIEQFKDTDMYEWVYTYDIRSTSPFNVATYKSPIYDLHHNIKYLENSINHIFGMNMPGIEGDSNAAYYRYMTDLSSKWNADAWLSSSSTENEYIIYLIPDTSNLTPYTIYNREPIMTHPTLFESKVHTAYKTNINASTPELTNYDSIYTNDRELLRAISAVYQHKYASLFPYTIDDNLTDLTNRINNINNLEDFYECFKSTNFKFVIKKLSELQDFNEDDFNKDGTPQSYLYNYNTSAFFSEFMIFHKDDICSMNTLYDKLKEVNNPNIVLHFKLFKYTSLFTLGPNVLDLETWNNNGAPTTTPTAITKYLDGEYQYVVSKEMLLFLDYTHENPSFYMCSNLDPTTLGNVAGSNQPGTSDGNELFGEVTQGVYYSYDATNVLRSYYNTFILPYTYKSLNDYDNEYSKYLCTVYFDNNVHNDQSLFSDNFVLKYNDSNEEYTPLFKLKNTLFFENGIDLTFYLMRAPKKIPEGLNYDIYGRDILLNSTNLQQTRAVVLDNNPPIYMPVVIEEEPSLIRNSNNSIVFRDTLGDHLVVWIKNKVFISEPSEYYYFKYTGMFSYPAKVIKVIQYKDTLLVFTTQDLYSIYPYETTIQVQDEVDDDGNPKYVQSTIINYATLPVLYNLMVDEKYADAIQVFNQMVLFYSADGQMFMIKPTATIDSNTRFSIQYFNKSINDVLANYDTYINERLQMYGIDETITKEDINIKVTVNINYIKIHYFVPNFITYIVIYDVINNYYTIYDTHNFTKINNIFYFEGEELYITEHCHRLYMTSAHTDKYTYNNNSDSAVYYYFNKEPIHTEIDTGNINLNNHLKKRFRNMYLIYKNINAKEIEHTIESFIDDTSVLTRMQDTIEVKALDGKNTYNIVQVSNAINLIADNTALFNFSDYNLNKIITHKSNIVCSGKNFRLRLTFNSKGRYKILGYGIIYKEQHV